MIHRILVAVVVAVTASTAAAQVVATNFFAGSMMNVNPTGSNSFNYIGGGFSGPAGMTVGPDNAIYISSQGFALNADRIDRYDPGTGLTTPFISNATLLTVPGVVGVYGPTGIQFDSSGNVYVARSGGVQGGDGQGAVDKFSPTGTYISTLVSGLSQPSALRIQGNDLFVSNLQGNTVGPTSGLGNVVKIASFATTPSVDLNFVAPTSGGLENPTGLEFDGQGRMYVADVSRVTAGQGNKVLRYNADGSFDSVFIAPGSGANPNDLQGKFTAGLLFDTNGDLIVGNLGNPFSGIGGSMFRYNAAGVLQNIALSDPMTLQFSPSAMVLFPVPEPTLLLVGVAGVFALRRWKRG